MSSAPSQPHNGLNLCSHVENPSCAIRAEACDASTAESVGAGKLVVEVGGRQSESVVPGLIALDALRGGAQHGEQIVRVLGLGGLSSSKRDELQYGDEFEGSDGQDPARRQGHEISVGRRFGAADHGEAGLMDDDLAIAFQRTERHHVHLLS